MMKRTVLIILFFFSALTYAQEYEQAIGVRAGYSGGLSYRRFINAWYGGEIIAQYNRNGFQLTGLIESQQAPFKADRLYLYYGGGLYAGNWDDYFALGITAIGGIEYVILNLPLSVSADWKPMLNLFKNFAVDPFDFAFTLRYTF